MRAFFLNDELTWPRLRALIDECITMNADKAAFAAKGLGDGSPYGLSKALANTYTLLLARRHTGLRVNACTPGFIETDMTRGYAKAQGKSPEELGMKPPAAGAKAPLHLLFGELEGNGRYYGSDAQRSPLDRYRSPGSAPYMGD
jgi:NAD(P)-dependent dehydrogenase (short-subunit alcohol dehydrogenase family)